MIDDPAEIHATEPATSRATAAELTALAWVRKARPDLDPDEQRALAARLSEKLPTLREPTKSRADDPLTVRERIPRFLAKLQAIPLTEKRRISGFVGQEKRELFELYKIRYVRSSLTDYRNAVRAAFGADHPAVTYLHLNETDVADVNESDRAQVRYRQTALRPIDPDRLIDIAVQLIASTSMYEIGMGIALLCGRRPFEIFNTGAIELDPDRPADHLRFFGQAKTKGSAPLTVRTIPTLIDADRVVNAWATLRAKDNAENPHNRIVDEPDAKAVNKRTAGRMQKCAKDHTIDDENDVRLTPKDLRAIYAEIAYAYFAPRTITKLAFFHQILGHAETDETSAMSYLRFYIAGHLGDAQAQNEIAKRDLAIALYNERNAQTTDEARALRDERITKLLTTLELTTKAEIAANVGEPVDPALTQHAQTVRALAAALSPHQEQLLRNIANAIPPNLTKDRVTLQLLHTRGILNFAPPNVTLTQLGSEVRAQLQDDFTTVS